MKWFLILIVPIVVIGAAGGYGIEYLNQYLNSVGNPIKGAINGACILGMLWGFIAHTLWTSPEKVGKEVKKLAGNKDSPTKHQKTSMHHLIVGTVYIGIAALLFVGMVAVGMTIDYSGGSRTLWLLGIPLAITVVLFAKGWTGISKAFHINSF